MSKQTKTKTKTPQSKAEETEGAKKTDTKGVDEATLPEDPFPGMETITLDEVSEKLFSTFTVMFAYQGYDPNHTFVLLKRLAKKAGVDKKEFMQDMVACCVFVMTRGTRITRAKVLKRTGVEGQSLLATFVKRYQIVDQRPDSRDSITMGRIAGCFPHICVKIMKAGLGRSVPQDYDDQEAPLDQALRFPGAAAIIPRGSVETFDAYLKWSAAFDAVINATATSDNQLKQYAMATWQSPLFSDEKRTAILDKVGVKY